MVLGSKQSLFAFSIHRHAVPFELDSMEINQPSHVSLLLRPVEGLKRIPDFLSPGSPEAVVTSEGTLTWGLFGHHGLFLAVVSFPGFRFRNTSLGRRGLGCTHGVVA